MKLLRATELMKKYAECQECGNDMIGAGLGTLEVRSDTFRRTCACGWTVEVKEVTQ